MAGNRDGQRFLLFIGRLGGGGAERVFVEYANGLSEAGAEVHLVCLEGGGYEADLVGGVQLYKLGTRMRAAVLPLLRVVRKTRPDVLLSGLTGANLVASIVGRLARVPEIWVSVHNDLRSEQAVQNSSLARQESVAIKIGCRLSTRVIAVSEGVAQFLYEEGHARRAATSVIYNPIYHDGIGELANVELPESIAALVEPGQPYLVAAGRLEQQKGFDLLVEAYRRSGLVQRGVKLLILGEGGERAALSEQIAQSGLLSSVYLLGFVDNPYSVFAKAQGFVLSSRWEGFGNVLVEALACGTPIVAFDCPSGPAEVLGETPGCIVVPHGDRGALAKAMLAMAMLDDLNETACKRKGRARLFSKDQAARKLLHLADSENLS